MNFDNIKNKIVSFLHDFENNEQKRNKFLVFFLLFIGVCSVFAGFSNTKEKLRKPFVDKEQEAIASIYDTYNELKASGKIKEDIQANTTNSSDNSFGGQESKTTDTDGDGLSDFDEVNIFKTSAFLNDSDGDGLSDFDEVKNGTNPNCPEGKNCSSTTTDEKAVSDIKYNSIDIEKIDIKQARIDLEKIVPENLKPLLKNMSDDEIKALLSELYLNSNINTDTKTNDSVASNTQSGSDYIVTLKSKLPKFTAAQLSTIENMSELEIKKLLLDSNIADNLLLSQFKTGELKETILGE